MNSDSTIAARAEKAGLPYEITGAETPMFMLSGALFQNSAVVAMWRDSHDDTQRAFVGYYPSDESVSVARAARRLSGVHSVAIVDANFG